MNNNWRKTHKERTNELNRKSYHKNIKKQRLRSKLKYQKNLEYERTRKKEYNKKFRAEHKEYYRIKSKEYRLKNKDKTKIRDKARKGKYGYGKLPSGFEYHHPDYTKPWMFQILTKKSHSKIHRKYK